LLIGGGWAAYHWGLIPGRSDGAAKPQADQPTSLVSSRPETALPDEGPYANVPERGSTPQPAEDVSSVDPKRGQALATAGRRALEQQQLVAARQQLGEALATGLELDDKVQVRADLTRLARETIFSNRILPDDPFVEAYVIKPGDTLAKIAKHHDVTADFLASINGIEDKNLIRAGQRIKVVRGPFRAVVTKQDYSLDVYLGDTFVAHYPVGLGADNSTPSGRWVVRDKLKNPTYYPPRGGKILQPDHPENPLGERWIGLVGVEGEAVGQERYGIHGTIEPDSIGTSVSLGCIRMHNADVEELFTLLVERKSEVIVQ
jgi:lipoprotein-anchoring transpeptidase ErfK/SrfK